MAEIIKGMPFEEYKKRPGVNASLLKTIDRYSLAHAKAQLDARTEDETDAKAMGHAFHSLLLEDRIDYAIHPETYGDENKPWNWNANICKAWAKEQEGKTIFNKDEAKGVELMAASAKAALSDIDLAGDREISIFAEKDGLPVKCRIDLLPADPSAPVIDFKSCQSAEPEKFLKQCYDLRYHMQCAWIIDVLRWAGIERKEVWLAAIESKGPFATGILKFSDQPISFLRLGRTHCRSAFQKLNNAYDTNRWPDYGQSNAEDHAQPWMLHQIEQTA
jgi:hypothetical protein